jgi:hypothetical protein
MSKTMQRDINGYFKPEKCKKEYILDMRKPFNTVINMKRLVFYKKILTEMSQQITLNNITCSEIIDGVLDDFPEELDAHKLCQEVMLRHLNAQLWTVYQETKQTI